MYFQEFPDFIYDFKYGNKTKTSVVKDITRNIRFRRDVLANLTLYDEYDVVDGETPEIIAEKIYGNPEYHWIIMLANQKYDYLSDFPKPQEVCERACIEKYNEVFTSNSWEYSNSTITVYKTNHGLLTSPTTSVKITGAVSETNSPNGTFVISSVTQNSFSYVVQSIPTGIPTGTVTVQPFGKENYIAYYVDERNLKVNSDFPGALPVTNLEDSRIRNEQNRRIKIISPQLVSKILKDYKELL
jgi:hypothetical protein